MPTGSEGAVNTMPAGGPRSLRVGVAQWAESALEELRELAGVRRVGLALVEGGGRRLIFASTDRDPSDLEWCHIDAFDDLPLNDALGSGTKLVGLLDELDPRYEPFVATQQKAGFAAIAAVPFKDSGRVLGGFVLYYPQSQSFDASQCAQLDELADAHAVRLHAALRRPGPSRPAYLPSEDSLTAAQEFPADPASAPKARRFLRATLAQWGVDEETASTAALCLTELVTNALIHAHSGCCVQVELRDQVLRTEVHDAGPGVHLQLAADEDRHRLHGRGLQIVDAMASRWGQIDGPDRAVVWFALDLPNR